MSDVLNGIDISILEGMSDEELADLADSIVAGMSELPAEEKEAFRLKGLALKAQTEFSVDGYCAFYELVFGRKPPRHVRKWIKKVFEGIRKGKNLLIEAFRGSTKSTTFICFLAYYIGHNPERTNLVIGAGDDDANEIVDMVADIISNNNGWGECFPHVVQDEQGHWGQKSGYDVVDTRKDYKEFRTEKQKHGRASTIKGVGYRSKYLPGPHPTGVLIVDDIYNYDNTSSEAEMIRIENTYDGTILPMKEPETVHILIGTPWTKNDLIAQKKTNKKYLHIFTPVRAPDGTPTWPEKYDRDGIKDKEEEINNPLEFARMYDLDLSKAEGLVLRKEWLKWYDHTKIGKEWPTFIGIDFTSTEDPTRRNVDYFSLTVAKMLPGNVGAVITHGFRQRVEYDSAQGVVVQYSLDEPYLIELGIEAIITGNDFHKTMLGNMQLVSAGIVPTALRGDWFARPKGERFELALGPAFKRGQLYLSDIYRVGDQSENNTEWMEQTRNYFRAFEDEWLNWQGTKYEKLHTNDTLDSTFIVFYLMSKWFQTDPNKMREAGMAAPTNPMYRRGQRNNNPFATLGRK